MRINTSRVQGVGQQIQAQGTFPDFYHSLLTEWTHGNIQEVTGGIDRW